VNEPARAGGPPPGRLGRWCYYLAWAMVVLAEAGALTALAVRKLGR
jgi:hypothetical protein